MSKIGRLKSYRSDKEAMRVRIAACRLAVRQMAGVDDAPRLNAYCIFFESYIASGPKWTQRHMKLLASPPKPAPVVQLITRDD